MTTAIAGGLRGAYCVDQEIVFKLHPMRKRGALFLPDAAGRVHIGAKDVHKIVIPSVERIKEWFRRYVPMLQLSNNAESGWMTLMFQNTAYADVGSAAGLQPSSSAGSIFVALSTGTLTATSTQSTTEAAYTSYAREGVARTSGGWTITGSSPTNAENAAAITFPACTGGSETETYFSTGYETSGAGNVFWYGALTASLAVSNGITPSFSIDSLVNGVT
jgi:hypothetical protein